MKPTSVGIDLGSTRIKAARHLADGTLTGFEIEPTPKLHGSHLRRECDALEYFERVDRVLSKARSGTTVPLGITSQRSSFLLWERETGRPVTPMISWQDRRGALWCDAHLAEHARIEQIAGLRVTPHYVGPKLAVLWQDEPALARRAEKGELQFGTLDTFLRHRLSGGRQHVTDATMAARTLLWDPTHDRWSEELLDLFGVPVGILPEVQDSVDPSKSEIGASLSDQASGVLGTIGLEERTALVTFGTGTFVLLPTGTEVKSASGYLSGPLLRRRGVTSWAIEGTINGGGAVADEHALGPTEACETDPTPGVFCIPDAAGIGAPHWITSTKSRISEGFGALDAVNRRRVVLEGLVFRVREIVEGLRTAGAIDRVFASGGLTNEPFLVPALATTLGQEIHLSRESEGTLRGTAALAAGISPSAARSDVVAPGVAPYLRPKYDEWRAWVDRSLRSEAPSKNL